MQHETLTYHADGLAMHGHLFFETAFEPRAGVLVFPEGSGLGEHNMGRAERLAGEGYVALACDLYGEGRQVSTLPDMMAELGPLYAAPDRIRARAMAALAALTSRPEVDPARIAAIGFCFGGTMALELARAGGALKAVVGFHSGLGTNAPRAPHGSIRPAILACIGADDPMIPLAQRAAFDAEMREAGADWQLHVYGNTVHSFTNPRAADRNAPDQVRYSGQADARSWASLQALFAQTLA